ncbi:MAG: hypothetical protein JWP09_671 [Candidatus Taylorbacteria bacterium]|nr:hypothetical protein [Candidatus Taylorbacteria bacterium]
MTSRFKNIIKQAKDVSLSSKENDSIKASLLEHMESHPLIEGSGGFNMHKRISYSEWVGNYFSNKKFMVPSALLLLLVLTGGISFASSGALPGSLLYPVKILNEKVSLAFATDQKEKVQMLTTNANTRLEEAEELYTQGKLDQKTETNLAQSFEEDSVQANVSLEHMKKDDKGSSDEEASRFRIDLGKHRKIIGDLRLDNKQTSSSTLPEAIDKVIARFDQLFNPLADSHDNDVKKDIKRPVLRQVFARPKEAASENKGTSTIELSVASTSPTSTSSTVDTDGSLNFWTQYKGDPVLKKADAAQTNSNTNTGSNHQNSINIPGVHVETNTGIKISVPKIHL